MTINRQHPTDAEAAERYPCDWCEAQPDEPCRTAAGYGPSRVATLYHSGRYIHVYGVRGPVKVPKGRRPGTLWKRPEN